MPMHAHQFLSFIPSPTDNGFHLGPLFIHVYGLMYVVGITLAIVITRRRWRALGGNPDLVGDVAIWAVPFGLIGARIYFDITTPADITPHAWWGVFAIWTGGLGVWGGIAAGAAAGIWRVRRAGANTGLFANAIAPALLVAQAVGRIGNYFNQELFGKPTGLPWALEIGVTHRPAGYLADTTFQPSFLYELIFDLALAAALVWLGHHRKIKPWGLFALYVAGYSGYRIFEETIRIDSSQYILGLRLNFFVATIMTLVGICWFIWAQRRPAVPMSAAGPVNSGAASSGAASPEHGESQDAAGHQPADQAVQASGATSDAPDAEPAEPGDAMTPGSSTGPGSGALDR
jgi:prolipoprotein diacylglyceryl transferase